MIPTTICERQPLVLCQSSLSKACTRKRLLFLEKWVEIMEMVVLKAPRIDTLSFFTQNVVESQSEGKAMWMSLWPRVMVRSTD